MNPNNENRRWTVSVDESGVLIFPPDLIAELGWKDGDELEWTAQSNGSFLLVNPQ